MSHDRPDLLLVDANLCSFALNNISPMSFFCGLHNTTASHKDPWAGPNGLIRSLIFQIICSLYRHNLLNIDLIHSRWYLKDLEEHDLATLCETLHRLVGQCSPEMAIYCVIGGIGCFDKGLHRSFQQDQFIIDALHDIVEDDMLRCRFKMLMTNSGQSTRRLRQLLDSTQHTILNNILRIGRVNDGRIKSDFIGRGRSARTPNIYDTLKKCSVIYSANLGIPCKLS